MTTKKTTKTNDSNPVPHVLLVWEEVPERTTFVLIPADTMTEDDHAVLRVSNGAYINGDTTPEQDTALICLDSALCENADWLSVEHPKGSLWAQRWVAYKRPIDVAITPADGVVVTHVYCCGVMM